MHEHAAAGQGVTSHSAINAHTAFKRSACIAFERTMLK